MNTRTILIASFAALAMSAGVPSVAATPSQSQPSGAGMMQQSQGSGQGRSMTRSDELENMMGGGMMGMHGGGMGNDHGMRGGGMMGMMDGGMMGVMSSCPMMMGAGLDRKTAMRMHGEMMRAIGDILITYADKIQEPAAKQ